MSKMKYILISMILCNFGMLVEIYAQDSSEFVLAKKHMLDELADCTVSITDLDDRRVDAAGPVISMQDILGTLNTLDELVEDELTYYQRLLENLTAASTYDMNLRDTTLQQIDELADDTLQEGQNSEDTSSCVSQQLIGEHVAANYTQWREPEMVGGYRRDSWARGIYRYSKFNACPDDFRCSLVHMVVLPDGSIAVSDAENYEIRVFSMQGVLLRKFDVLPLDPRYMAHYQGFQIFVRMKNLDGNYIIAGVDLWKMTIKTVIEFFEDFTWEFACASPFTVVNDVIFVGCTPYLFMYDVNGTQLHNFTTSDRQRIFVFHSEEGSERIFLDAPPIPDMISNRPTVINFASPTEPFCSLQHVTWALAGAVGASNTVYAVEERERYRVKKYGPNCEPEGTVVEINRSHEFVTLVVFGDLLVAQVEGKWRRRSNNMIQVFKLGG